MTTHTQQQLNQFAAQQWGQTMAFLQSRFSLPREDCEDIFQESFLVLYQNIIDGKLENATASLSTYFNSICRNKAHELMRSRGKTVFISDKFPDATQDSFNSEKIDSILSLAEDAVLLEQRKDALVREIVTKLPKPCDKILWGVYRDGFSMKTLADMFHYSGENSVKVTKHRCTEKFRNRFKELSHNLFDEPITDFDEHNTESEP